MIEIAVCDDEKEELDALFDMLQEICAEIKRECHISRYQSPAELLKGEQRIDIGILDIVMQEENGIDLGRKLRERYSGIRLIYATSYEDYYRQVINKVHAFSCLTKPVDKQELKEQLLECMQEVPAKECSKELVFENVRNAKGEELESVRLRTEEILYCEYVKTKREISIVLPDEVYYYREVFETLSRELACYSFAINSRGSIVNLRHIRRLKGYSIYLDNGVELQLAQKRVADFKEQMNAYIHRR